MDHGTQASLETATAREIASQPDVWRRALGLEADALARLPRRSETVLALGCGTSFYVLEAYARRRQELAGTITRAAIASEVDELSTPDRVLYLSRSGTTGELLQVHERYAGRIPTVAICGTPGSPLAGAVDEVLLLPFADEESVVQTRFATAALTVLRRSIGDAVDALPAAAEQALRDELPVEPGRHGHVVFLGTGWSLGLAEEAALKCREAARLHAEAYAAGEYLHGPIALAGESSLVWSLGPLPDRVRDAVRRTGAALVEASGDPQAELVRVHRLALETALARGLDPDRPIHLSRSVLAP